MSVHVTRLPMAADPLIDEANQRKRRRRRFLAGALVVALVVGLSFALRPLDPKNAGSGVPASHSGAADTTRAEARDIADRLVAETPLPPGARRVSQPAGRAVMGAPDYGKNIFTAYEYRHGYWQVREPLGSVEAFLRSHSPPTFTLDRVGSTWPNRGESYTGRSAGGRIPSRVLVSLHRSNGVTFIRVDGGVTWTVPRPTSEVVPASVREVDIHSVVPPGWMRHAGAHSVTRRVTDPREVARIVKWFNALNVSQPYIFSGCLVRAGVQVQFSFRSAGGAELATAAVPSGSASSCDPIQFTINGKAQQPLVDSTPLNGRAFIEHVQRMLGVGFAPTMTHG